MDYDVAKAIERIEDELIYSIIRNLKRHRAEETKEGFNWEMWQVKQLQSLNKFKKDNLKYKPKFAKLNKQIEELLIDMATDGSLDQEKAILEAIKKGYKPPKRSSNKLDATFFKYNSKKLEALISETSKNMAKAETAILRMAHDKYISIIFDAQMYAATGAGTYEKAVDMATRDFLSAGINCVEYSNGARHTLSNYARMAIRTASKRAYLQGEGEQRREWGIHTVIVNKRGNPCPKCLPFVGKVLIDDVWSGGSKKDGDYMLMSSAIAAGLYHPNCKDSHTTYFEGLTTRGASFTKKEIETIEQDYLEEQKQLYAQNQAKKYQRLADNSLDEGNKQKYMAKADDWQEKLVRLKNRTRSGIINIEIDEFVPCLKDANTGEILDTEVFQIMDRNLLKGYTKKNGWNINWFKIAKDNEVYALVLKGESEFQGLIGLRPDKDARAVYLNWASTAPRNNKILNNGKQDYIGVGGHLFAIGAEKSLSCGYDGVMYGFAANETVMNHYIYKFGAENIPIQHPYQIIIDERAAQNLLNEYNFSWKE